MRIRFLGTNQTTAALLLFQVTAFLVPWLVVVWLSNSKDISQVADYSFLLALFAPLALLTASPSRNYLLSSDTLSVKEALGLRLFLCAVGCLIAFGVGLASELLLLSLFVYLAKATEFFFDLPIATSVKDKQARKLVMLAMAKIGVIGLGVITALSLNNLPIALAVLSLGFVLTASGKVLRQVVIPQHFPSVLAAIVPLSLSALVFSVYFNIPRYLLGVDNNDGVLAIFTISSFLLTILLVINNAFCQAQLHHWASLLKTKQLAQLNHSILKGALRSVGLFALLQVWQIPLLFDAFWLAHNNLHMEHPNYPSIFRWVLLLAIGPLLFSYANYLLIVVQAHRRLLIATLLNTLVTGGLAWIIYAEFGFVGVLWLTALSGVVHGLYCLFQYMSCVKKVVA